MPELPAVRWRQLNLDKLSAEARIQLVSDLERKLAHKQSALHLRIRAASPSWMDRSRDSIKPGSALGPQIKKNKLNVAGEFETVLH